MIYSEDLMVMYRQFNPELSDDQIIRLLSHWTIHPHHTNGALDGFLLSRGPEVHTYLAPGFRLNRGVFREFLRPVFEKRGYLTTRLEPDDAQGLRLVKFLGFGKSWGDELFDYYLLSHLPFERAT